MLRTIMLIPMTALGLALPASALADAPASGVVVEGQSVPGVALGDTRAQVVAAWGPPDRCYDREVTGDQSACRFPIDGGGIASVEFRGADGRYARNAPEDVVFEVSWGDAATLYGQIIGDPIDWTTTAGVNTELALTDQDSVAAAYPDAELTYDSLGIAVLDEAQQGIRITWGYDSYTHRRGVRILIHYPQPALRGEVMSVTELELTATKTRSVRHILAVVRVQDELGLPVDGAQLSVRWTDPLGRTWTINSHNLTSETGYEFFEVGDAHQGTWTFTVNDVTRDGNHIRSRQQPAHRQHPGQIAPDDQNLWAIPTVAAAALTAPTRLVAAARPVTLARTSASDPSRVIRNVRPCRNWTGARTSSPERSSSVAGRSSTSRPVALLR